MKVLNKFLCICLLFATYQVGAQNALPSGNLKGWESLKTDHFEIFFIPINRSAALKAVKYAELARHELGLLYDFEPKGTYTLVYIGATNELLYTNTQIVDNERAGDVFALPKKVNYVVDPGTDKELFSEVKRKVSDLIIMEFSHRDKISSALQDQVLFYNPKWFQQGLNDYAAGGWTFHDDLWINSIARGDELLTNATEGEGELNRIARKSIWYFVDHEYGDSKISEIIYLVNITNSVEAGIVSVLGISLKTLTERWREFMLSRASSERKDRIKLANIPGIKEVQVPTGYQLQSFDYSDNGDLVAMNLNKMGKVSLWLYNIDSETYQQTEISSGFSFREGDRFRFPYPIAWNPSGDMLATIRYQKTNLELVYHNVLENTTTVYPLDREMSNISHISWSPDGNSLAISVLHGGSNDVFVGPLGEPQFTAITDDPYDNLEPSWSWDGRALYFVSNRDTSALNLSSFSWGSHKRNYDLYQYNLERDSKTLDRLTRTPFINERIPQVQSKDVISFLSDVSGVKNVNIYSISSGESSFFSDVAEGMFHADIVDKQIVFSSPISGGLQLFKSNLEDLKVQRNPVPTLNRIRYDAMLQKELLLQKTQIPPVKVAPQPVEEAPTEDVVEKESQEEKKKERVRYYIFDEEEEAYEIKKPDLSSVIERPANRPKKSVNSIYSKKEAPDLYSLDVKAGSNASSKWYADHLQMGIAYEPIAGYGLRLGVGFSDLLNNHRIQLNLGPYLKFRNQDVALRYDYLPMRVKLHASVNLQNRFYRLESVFSTQDTISFLYQNHSVSVGATYPITDKFGVGVEANAMRLARNDLKLLRTELEDQEDYVFAPRIYAYFNNVEAEEGFARSGLDAQFQFQSYYSTENSEFLFHTAKLNGKYYWEILDNIVLAARLHAGISLAPNNVPFEDRQRFYIGGLNDQLLGVVFEQQQDNALRFRDVSDDLYAFTLQEFLMPNRGFDFFARNGARYVVSNVELRIPISRLTRTTLPSNPLYNLELIPFLDVGTTWDEGNPFSTKKPTDTQIVGSSPVIVELQTLKSPFLIGFGTGVSTRLIGYQIRMDLSWGIDDNTLKAPIFTASIGKSF